MGYTVHQLAALAGVSVRTLHHYDQVGLLKPQRQPRNGYRHYGEADLLRLQQILFFRELDFQLSDIKKIIDSPAFDLRSALEDQRHLLELKKQRINRLIKTIDETANKLTTQTPMTDNKLYDAFDDEDMKQYALEAKQRWGRTEAYRQSQERIGKMSKADMDRLKRDGEIFTRSIADIMDKGADSPEAQEKIRQHYNGLRTFYEPNLEMYRGLGRMYVEDPRFAAYYDRFRPGLARFMNEAIRIYCDNRLSDNK